MATLIPTGMLVAGLAGLFVMNELSDSALTEKATRSQPKTVSVEPAQSAAKSAQVPTALETAAPPSAAPADGRANDRVATADRPTPPLPMLSLAAIAPVLDTFKCSALDATVKGNSVSVSGYANSSALDSLKRKLMSVPGVTAVDTDVRALTDGMCDAVDLFRPYWRLNREKGYGASIKTINTSGELVSGEPLVVRLTTPPFESYVNVDYYSLDGHVIHMLPSPRAAGNQAPANYAATLGDLNQWVIGAPFGTEMVAVFTTPEPMFAKLRSETEPAGDYLKALKQRLDAMDAGQRAKTAADFALINTRRK